MLSLEQGALSFVYVHGHHMYSVWVVDVCTCVYTRTVGSGIAWTFTCSVEFTLIYVSQTHAAWSHATLLCKEVWKKY